MELTGKALKDFWEWYLKPEQKKQYKTQSLLGGNPAKQVRFLSLSFTERFGVFVDFFDSKGLYLDIKTEIESTREVSSNFETAYHYVPEFWFYEINSNSEQLHFESGFKSRAEARTATIEKANEIYNQPQE